VEKKLILRGLLAGAVGGMLAFLFARVFAEPQIQAAIDYEGGRDEAQEALEKVAGLAVPEHGHDIFSRAIQANVGIGVGMIALGIALGALFAVAYALCLGRVGGVRPRQLALLVAAGAFLALYLVPFLKYPANPPAVGQEDTIGQRGSLYLIMVGCSVAFGVCAVWLGQRLRTRFGAWNATLLAGGAFVVAIGLIMALLPGINEVPRALTDPSGTIVFPGFPADTLASFRLYSVAAQVIFWATVALVFAPMADRLLRAAPAQALPRQSAPSPATV
jgi:hypothetical protein